MINFYDIDSVETLANSRRERFLQEIESDRINRMLAAQRPHTPGWFRRAVGVQLIRAGARLSGDQSALARQTGAMI